MLDLPELGVSLNGGTFDTGRMCIRTKMPYLHLGPPVGSIKPEILSRGEKLTLSPQGVPDPCRYVQVLGMRLVERTVVSYKKLYKCRLKVYMLQFDGRKHVGGRIPLPLALTTPYYNPTIAY